MNEKNVLVSLTVDEAKCAVGFFEDELLGNNVSADDLKTTVKALNKLYEALEYVEKN